MPISTNFDTAFVVTRITVRCNDVGTMLQMVQQHRIQSVHISTPHQSCRGSNSVTDWKGCLRAMLSVSIQCMYTPARPHTPAHARTHAHVHAYARTRTRTCTPTHVYIHIQVYWRYLVRVGWTQRLVVGAVFCSCTLSLQRPLPTLPSVVRQPCSCTDARPSKSNC